LETNLARYKSNGKQKGGRLKEIEVLNVLCLAGVMEGVREKTRIDPVSTA